MRIRGHTMHPKEKGIRLLDAISEGNQDEALQLIRSGADLTMQRKGDNAIHLAAQHGYLDIIRELKGVDLELPNLVGNTVAHFAAIGGYVHIIKYLKGKGVNLNSPNDFGHGPLHEAAIQQPMDILESFIELGMDPNMKNTRNGQTPAHAAAIYGRRMAIEALVLRGAKLGIRDHCQRKPEDVSRDESFRQVVRMYDAMETAFGLCAIQAAGMKLTNSSARQVHHIDRVGIVLERVDNVVVPNHSPASFYCRRESPELASVPLKHFQDEHVFSDVFFLLVSNVREPCPASLLLPLQGAPSVKEELVLRFINSGDNDRKVDGFITKDQNLYCPLKTELTPDVSCICLLYVRPRQQEFVIPPEGAFIQTEMEPDFSLDVPPGAFETGANITIKVFDTDSLNVKTRRKADWGMKPQSCPLMTSVFDIKLTGAQPKKAITVQLPVTGDLYKVDEFVVVRTEQDAPIDETADVLPVKPKFINNNLIFTVTHFSTYVAVPKDKLVSKNDAKQIERHLSFARERRKPATFFAVVKHIEGLSFIMLVDFGLASKSRSRQRKWMAEGFETRRPAESEAFMVTPGDSFNVDVKGYASFEDPTEGKARKFRFSACRMSCYQTFRVNVAAGFEDLDCWYADLVINREVEDGQYGGSYQREVCRLGVYLNNPYDRGTTIPTPLPTPIATHRPRHGGQSVTPRQNHTPRPLYTEQTPREALAMVAHKKKKKHSPDDGVKQSGPCQGVAYIKSHNWVNKSRTSLV